MSQQLSVETGLAPVQGSELYYEVVGTGDWMVFAHGGEGTRIHWWQQVAYFAPRYRCVTYDGRGFGSSPTGTASVSDNPLRDDLLGLLDHLGIGEATLVGHSMGGLAVSGVAQTRPKRVRRLVMSDSPFNFATSALATWSEQMIAKIGAGFSVMDHLYAPGFEVRAPELSYLYRALNRINPPFPSAGGVAAYEAWRDQPEGDYGSFVVPTLFIVGSEDELTLPWLMRATAEAVNGAQLVEVDGVGHSCYAERAEEFNAAVGGFCAIA
jgi:3-oxoadipate enol-lactonase